MGDWPKIETVGFMTATAVQTNTYPISVLTSATTNTKGSYTELISSTVRDAYGFMTTFMYGDSTMDFLTDIAIGAAGSETIIVNNIILSRALNERINKTHHTIFPVFIPSGTRLSARVQGHNTGGSARSIQIGLHLLHGPWPITFAAVDTIGADTADSGGISIDPGTSANTKGSYTELTSSTSFAYSGFIVGFGNQLNAGRQWAGYAVDIAIGSSSNETIILPDLFISVSGGNMSITPDLTPFIPIKIPSGTRISARAQSYTADTTDRKFDIVLYCFR